jgi:cell wall-associated NlpC family hydrolase
MPKSSRRSRALAMPVIGALLVGAPARSPETASASGTTTSTVAAPSAAVGTTTLTLQRRKEIRNNKIRRGGARGPQPDRDPYRYGAAGPNAFDCSGLTSYAFGRPESTFRGSSDAQGAHVRRISKSRMKRGDLVFFHSGGGVYHVAIYLKRKHGERIILHASRTGTPVKRDPIWTSSWFAGTMRVRG